LAAGSRGKGFAASTSSTATPIASLAVVSSPVLDAFEIDLRHQVAAIAPRRVFVHAGVAA
jgi:hypothetical protein